MKKRTKWILLLVLAGLLITFAAFAVDSYILQYCNDYGRTSKYLSNAGYAAVLGIDEFDPDDFLAVYGEPESVQRWFDPDNANRELVLHSYPSFDVLYVVITNADGDTYLHFLQVTIKDEDIRFGRLKIGVGSRRCIVHLAYLLEPKLSEEDIAYSSRDFPDIDEGFYGEDWWSALFHYGADGKVKTMVYDNSAF